MVQKEFATWFECLLAALYISECWYAAWRIKGRLHYKARGIVMYDRVLNMEQGRE